MKLLLTLTDLADWLAAFPGTPSYLFWDTETTGMVDRSAPISAPHQPRVCQLAAVLCDSEFRIRAQFSTLLRPNGWRIAPAAATVHGITDADCGNFGIPQATALAIWGQLAKRANLLVSFNAEFDVLMTRIESDRLQRGDPFADTAVFCAMRAATPLCAIPKDPSHPSYSSHDPFKWPRLSQALELLCGQQLVSAHDALADVLGLRQLHQELHRRASQPLEASAQRSETP
jgi:DNA polymerase-3 subunit epsilon